MLNKSWPISHLCDLLTLACAAGDSADILKQKRVLRYCSELRLSAIVIKRCADSFWCVCPEAGKEHMVWWDVMSLLVAWLCKMSDVTLDSRCESQSGRCDSPAFWIWQLAAQRACYQTHYLSKCLCYDLCWGKGSRSRDDRDNSTVL